MKRILFLFSILASLFYNSFSQNDSLKIKRNNINLEILGIGVVYSFNYERLIRLNDEAFLSFAVGYENLGSDHLIITSGSFLLGNRNFLEIGYGLTNELSDNKQTFKCARVGYRYQKDEFLFRACFTPIFNFKILGNEGILPSIGLTLGYCF
jgi:hypothetical protein